MGRTVGTISRGIRTPIIRQGDNIVDITVESVLAAAREENFQFNDKDVIAITEAVVARAQGNYATVDNIAKDVEEKFAGDTVGIVFPILSRNRFAPCLKGIARGVKKIVLMLSYPSDEVGNYMVDLDQLEEHNINPWTDVLTEKDYRKFFGYTKHAYTGVDYIDLYKNIITDEGCEGEIILANDSREILSYTKTVITCDVHNSARTKRILKEAGVEKLYGLDEILNKPIDGSGYNEKYGLLGSNLATDDSVKLFPRDCQPIVDEIQKKMFEKTGKKVEVMVYGDGAFKDPACKIWELADPVVSPAYTEGLEGQPNEVKLKYLADNDFADLKGEELERAIFDYIQNKEEDLSDDNSSLGTTPRRITDLLGSLSDLTSGSGDKGTPVVLIQGYFDSFSI